MTIPVFSRCYRCNMEVGDIRAHDQAYHGEPPDVRTARKIVNEYECQTFGHSWDVVEALGVGPTAVVCSRCGESHKVVRDAK